MMMMTELNFISPNISWTKSRVTEEALGERNEILRQKKKPLKNKKEYLSQPQASNLWTKRSLKKW